MMLHQSCYNTSSTEGHCMNINVHEENCLLVCDSMFFGRNLTMFRRDRLPPSSGCLQHSSYQTIRIHIQKEDNLDGQIRHELQSNSGNHISKNLCSTQSCFHSSEYCTFAQYHIKIVLRTAFMLRASCFILPPHTYTE